MMTPITFNLLAEEQRAQHASARDPVKITIGISVVLIALVVGVGAWLQTKVERTKQELAEARKRQQGIEDAQTKGGGGFAAVRTMAADVVAINQSRLLYSPELAMVKDLIPDGIQLTTLKFSLAKEAAPIELPPPVEKKGSEEIRPRRSAPKAADHLVLQLEGKAFGAQPELVVDSFIKGLRDNAGFMAKVKEIQLRSIARAPMPADGGAVSNPAVFVVECQYQERK